MFNTSSRYCGSPIATLAVAQPDGTSREIRYLRRRIIPADEERLILVEHTVTAGDRPDNITARYLGDPRQFWRLADANNVFEPDELATAVGRVIIVPANKV